MQLFETKIDNNQERLQVRLMITILIAKLKVLKGYQRNNTRHGTHIYTMSRTILKNLVNEKTHLTMKPLFMSSTDSNENCTVNNNSENIEISIGEDTDEIIQELFDLLSHSYQTCLEQSTKDRNFLFDYVDVLH